MVNNNNDNKKTIVFKLYYGKCYVLFLTLPSPNSLHQTFITILFFLKNNP